MNTLEFTLVVAAGSFVAGMLGALTGLGGGVVIVPLLTLVFGVDIRYAIGASLVSVIATSSGAAAAYLKEGYSNMRVGMFLEMATTAGALSGAFIAGYVSTSAIAIIFGVVLLYSAYTSFGGPKEPEKGLAADRVATFLRLDGTFPADRARGAAEDSTEREAYHVRNVPAGFSLMYVAGVLSGLLGIGSGAVKVLAMDQAMKIPFKVSTTTSNFMIGVTAAASAGIYLRRGYIDPALALPVMLGVLAGALVGALILPGAKVRSLRIVFGTVIAALGVQMILEGIRGKL
ncbi:MAG TPA: sulfite exporter TauE/SafE family protein [Candidatus Acidoferrales bacterium]